MWVDLVYKRSALSHNVLFFAMATSAQYLPVAKSELDIFRPRAVQLTQSGYETIPLQPINSVSVTSKRLEFFHPGKNTDFFRNMANTFFYIKFKICQPDGNPLATGKDVAPINYVGQTVIKTLDISLNGTQITRNTGNHAHRAMIDTLLTSDQGHALGHLSAAGWRIDTGTGAEIKGFDKTNNKGLAERLALVANGKAVELISKLHIDIGNSHKYLPSGLDLAINIDLNSDAFILMADSGVVAADVEFHLISATLYTEICHINTPTATAIERVFMDRNAVIPIQTREVHAINVGKGLTSISVDNIITGKLPSIMIIGFIENAAHGGTLASNPFCFVHGSLRSLNVVVNGVQHPLGPFDFETNKNYVRGYHSLMTAAGLLAQGESSLITFESYSQGFALFGIDLSPTGTAASDGSHSSPSQVGNVRLEVLFNNAPSEALTMIVYTLHEGGSIEFDRVRNVYVSF